MHRSAVQGCDLAHSGRSDLGWDLWDAVAPTPRTGGRAEHTMMADYRI